MLLGSVSVTEAMDAMPIAVGPPPRPWLVALVRVVCPATALRKRFLDADVRRYVTSGAWDHGHPEHTCQQVVARWRSPCLCEQHRPSVYFQDDQRGLRSIFTSIILQLR